MANPPTELLEMILRECLQSRPHPWYPAHFALATGVRREALDSSLDRLRLGGLVKLTEWIQDHGQGYQITPEGEEVLRQPRLLARLRQGEIPQVSPVAMPSGPVAQHALRGLRGEKVREALTDESRPIITHILIALNVAAFLAELAVYKQKFGGQGIPLMPDQGGNAYSQTLDYLGALRLDLVIEEGQWWRILTSAFLHIGILHIGMNMLALYRLGPLIERMLGRPGYLALYLLSAVGSSMAVLWLSPKALTAGASGAICGIFGAMAMWLFLNKAYLPPHIVRAWQSNIVQNVVLIVIISLMPGVSWSAHLGGAMTGLIVAAPVNLIHFGEGPKRWLGWAATAALAVVGFLLWHWALTTYRVPELFGPDLVMTRVEKLLARGDEIFVNALNKAESDVLRTKPENLNAAKAAELAKYFQVQKVQLEQRVNTLEQEDLSARPDVAQVVKAGLATFVPAAEFFGKIAKVCEAGGVPAPADRITLQRERNTLIGYQKVFHAAWTNLK
jgi:membrane associated rhomboid family serine protease